MNTILIKPPQDNKPLSEYETTPDWPVLIKKWEQSQISQIAFCKKHHLSFNQFSYQRSKLRSKKQSVSMASSPSLLPVKILGESGVAHYTLQLPHHVTLLIPKHFIADEVKQLLALLGHLS